LRIVGRGRIRLEERYLEWREDNNRGVRSEEDIMAIKTIAERVCG
jgi:hypothetical protein